MSQNLITFTVHYNT